MDLEPPALFFHPQEIQTNLDSSFSVQLYGLKLNPAASAHLDIRYDWGSVQIDSVVADSFFPFQITVFGYPTCAAGPAGPGEARAGSRC